MAKRRKSVRVRRGPKSVEDHIDRVRTICLKMPAASERLSHGEPTFFVGKRVFAMVSNDHHGDGRLAVVVPFEPGLQAMMLRDFPRKFFYPPYVGVRGWLGVHLARVSDRELALHVQAAWRLVAPKRLVKAADEGGG